MHLNRLKRGHALKEAILDEDLNDTWSGDFKALQFLIVLMFTGKFINTNGWPQFHSSPIPTCKTFFRVRLD